MAKAKKLPSGQWRTLAYSHTDASGKRHYESFTAESKKESEYLAAEFQLNKKKQNNECKMTYQQALEAYIENRSSILSPSTVREYKRCSKRGFDTLRKMRICDITQDDIQVAVNAEAVKLAPKTVRNMHGLLSAVMSVYRPDFAIHTDLPKRVRTKLYVPSDEEVKRVLDYARENDPDMELAILLAAFGPMRRSEISALESDNITGNVVHVVQAMVLNDNKEWIIKKPKSYAGDRYITFPDFVIKKLKCCAGRVVPLTPGMITDRFRKMLKKAGVQHFRFHDLRHYSASIQHVLGTPDAYIMQRGGWGNDAVLKNVYRHTLEDKEKEVNDKINDYFSQLAD